MKGYFEKRSFQTIAVHFSFFVFHLLNGDFSHIHLIVYDQANEIDAGR